jgi:hypothetical protein
MSWLFWADGLNFDVCFFVSEDKGATSLTETNNNKKQRETI